MKIAVEENLRPEPGSVATAKVNHILRAAQQLGADKAVVGNNAGLDMQRLRNPIARLPIQMVLRLLKRLEIDFADNSFSIQMGQNAKPQNFSDLGYEQRYFTNLLEALKSESIMQMMRQNIFKIELECSDAANRLSWHLEADEVEKMAQFSEFIMGAMTQFSQDFMGGQGCFSSIYFQHKPRFPIEKYRQIFGCNVEFSAERTMADLLPACLYQPNNFAQPELAASSLSRFERIAGLLLDGQQMKAITQIYLFIEMDKSPVSLAVMARSLGMTERTARRQLNHEGNSFRELLDDVRQQLWELYAMEGTRSLTEISRLLGYARPSAFTRAHNRWYGHPPSELQTTILPGATQQ